GQARQSGKGLGAAISFTRAPRARRLSRSWRGSVTKPAPPRRKKCWLEGEASRCRAGRSATLAIAAGIGSIGQPARHGSNGGGGAGGARGGRDGEARKAGGPGQRGRKCAGRF